MIFTGLLFRDQKKLFIAFYPQIDGQTERQNSTIEVYLRAFVNCEQNNWAKLLPIAEFAYNNTKNASTSHTLYDINCGYYPKVLFKKDVDSYSKFRSANKLADELRALIEISCQHLLHVQKLEKRVYYKRVKDRSYTPGQKIWLNSKYIKIKWIKKLEMKFFGLF